MYKIFIRKRDINDATAHYVDIITNALKKLGYDCEYVYSTKNISKEDKVLVITLPGFVLAWLHNPKQDISMWFQGIVPEECCMSFTGFKKVWKFWMNRVLDFFTVHMSKRILFVSKTMYEHYKSVYGYNGKNYMVMPCFNQKLEKDAFKDEKYKSPTFVYAGSLAKWQCIDETMELFKKIKSLVPNATLTLLTGEKENAYSKIKEHSLSDVNVKYIPYKELNNELSLYKYGFLIREDVKVNNVATPTKMNSYMACGLIPVYSNVIGDFKEEFAALKYKVEVGDEESALKQIVNLERNEILANAVYEEYKHIFDTYYSEDYYIDSIVELFSKENF